MFYNIGYIPIAIQPWDIEPLKIINTKYNSKVIIFSPYLVIAQTNDSNIRNGVSVEENAKECGWDLNSFDLTN